MRVRIVMTLVGYKQIEGSTSIKSKLVDAWDKIQCKLDDMYFANLPDHYPEASAIISCHAFELRAHRIAGSNSAGNWKKL